ncbi:4-(cytidine 5'-diphospho)-2-C-methyl-D-erythritol kinase [Gloeobacter violaceus]|uniref:4-diphosphocytidyl-2-C-methyl-D-erythritol kinase n=1 Tax=Gloeobacter violaceus (strain ATCC 29082 / PCC 7421) TaxID=251221 RepID=ISPE_GLOVI|nr:4-(cytidine 5'-diphospho)-2-C-methyl-D-erythritol kinase [Gloeobacter violaceus]Q7NPF3.1 RecName: Full=4-diphosphocytidyl-2-C-methyl-D-erythritol kinase; Short=CMK; AltName: Full=4-(cytidine-5'-diphospho)-2-C-methyl-D-erythritol kinase [Gloeobacter violaceus PCC 7421]BAC88043.1 4-diphosphocytidyl-2C-methyl-D-erythritol kinase [Gloeobacter violaceus PCC 7421]
MKTVRLRAAAKINLYLEILGVRPDNFHELVMVLQSVDLADTVTLRAAPTTRVSCSHPLVPNDRTNLAVRAVEVLQKHTGIDEGVEIVIEKRIPVASGLAGGSTDAAAVLAGLNVLWDLGLTQRQLQSLGAQIGSDIPFCVTGGTALAMGRGEVLSPLPALKGVYLVLAKLADLQVSTAWAYQTYRREYLSEGTAPRARTSALLSAVASQEVARIAPLLHNDLERAVLPAYPQVSALREHLVSAGALGAMMSGSGPAVFGLARDRAHAEAVCAVLAGEPGLELFVCKTQQAGILMEESESSDL